MTLDEAKLVLDNARPQTKEIDRQFYDDEDLNNALDMAIKALEQQSSDCVSRADLYKILKLFGEQPRENDITTDLIYLVKDSDIVELPPVAPIHGTCKDCKHWCRYDGLDTCKLILRARHKDFYCADFEKRGVENE